MPAELAPAVQCAVAPALLDELWRSTEAEACGLTRPEFEQMVLRIGIARNFGLEGAPGAGLEARPDTGAAVRATAAQQAAFFASLRMADLVLARACGSGSERAWERFIGLY